MEEENKEKLFDEVPTEGQDIEEVLAEVDKETQDEKPAESSAEKEEVDLKKNDAWKELRESKEKAEAKALELEEKLKNIDKEDPKSKFITSLVGDNKEVEAEWLVERENLKEQVKNELLQAEVDAQKKEQEQKEYWLNWTNDRLSEVEKEFKVDFKSDESKKNELSKIMLEYSPTDEQGNLDYRKGMRILNDLSKVKEVEEKTKTQVKKNIADSTISKHQSSDKNKDVLTTNDFRGGRGWRSVVKKN